MRRNQKGFTLIELLIVVAIIGILAAIAIPNLLTALQRAKQKRSMSDARTIATAWEARATDTNKYNAAAASCELPGTSIDVETLNTYLAPTYVKTFPQRDGWGNPWVFAADQAWGGTKAAQAYSITSYGKDGVKDKGICGPTTNFDCDIIYANGSFVEYAQGVQQQ